MTEGAKALKHCHFEWKLGGKMLEIGLESSIL